MKLVVWKNYLGSQILNGSPNPVKKRRLMFTDFEITSFEIFGFNVSVSVTKVSSFWAMWKNIYRGVKF